jgi:hypothetical protein
MIIPTGTVHDARATAATVREIICQRCRNPFFFLLERTGKGRAQTAFFFGMKEADRKASLKARGDLEKKLATEVDPVSCPYCRYYPPQMVAAARRRLFPWHRIVAAWAIAHFGAGYALSLALPQAPLPFLALPGIAVLAFLLCRRLSFDPNRSPAAAERLRARFPFQAFQTREAATAALQGSGDGA